MPRSGKPLGGLNIHGTEPGAKPVGSGNRVQLAATGVVLAAMMCGLSAREAEELAACTALVGAAAALQPWRAGELREQCWAATVDVVANARRRRAA